MATCAPLSRELSLTLSAIQISPTTCYNEQQDQPVSSTDQDQADH